MSQLLATQELLFAGYRLTGQLNQIADQLSIAELDATVFGTGRTVVHKPGLKGYGLSAGGLWAATEDLAADDNLVTENIPLSFLLTDGTAGSPARSVKAMQAILNRGPGAVGQLLPFDFAFGAMARPVRGTVLYNDEASGNVTGTAFELGAVDDDPQQYLYGVLHVFSGTGSFIVKIQSDSSDAFSTPTDRITFATVATGTPSASEWATPVAGAITDTWWRITATNPNTRDFAVVAAIQS